MNLGADSSDRTVAIQMSTRLRRLLVLPANLGVKADEREESVRASHSSGSVTANDVHARLCHEQI